MPKSLSLLLASLILLSGCKLQITVPTGGDVPSLSRTYDCASGETCVVEVDDFYFSEEFTAEPWQGWVFMGWKSDPAHFCKNSRKACQLSTTGFEGFDSLSSILDSDDTFYLEPTFTQGTPIDQAISAVVDANLRACLRHEVESAGEVEFAQELVSLECGTLVSIAGIEAFVGLEHLNLDDFENAQIDLKPLAPLTRLKSLEIVGNSDDETLRNTSMLGSALMGMTQLEHLDLSGNGIGDLGPLAAAFAGMNKLRSLDLHGNEFDDVNALTGLKRLQILNLLDNPFLEDISPLAGLKRLQSLDTAGSGITDIGSLAELTQLQFLRIGGGAAIQDISSLSDLKQLQSLTLDSSGINDIGPLAALTELRSLDLNYNDIIDLKPLAGLKRLRTLGLSSNDISDISALGGMTKLKVLHLESNRISVVGTSLDFMTRGEVYLSGNPLSCDEARSLVTDEGAPAVHYFPLPEDIPDYPYEILPDCI